MLRVKGMMTMSNLSMRVAARFKQKKRTEEGNTVYLYSERQIALRNRKKAQRLEKLAKKIDALRDQYKKDIESDDPEVCLTALAVALIDHTFERVGNFTSADEGHFGVTGWQRGHISWDSRGNASIKYVGKSGVKHHKKVTDAAIRKALRNAYEAIEGDETPLFAHDDVKIDARKVNDYLSKFDVTAKDLRGFHANREMRERLQKARKAGGKLPEEKKDREKVLAEEFNKALEETAAAVGHEASTLKNQYLVPGMEERFLKDGTVIDKFDVKKARVEIGPMANRVLARYLGEVDGTFG
jgi:hypothetical protein